MSNLAENLPRFVRDRIEDAEARGRDLAGRVDSLIEKYIPESIVEPLRTDEGLSLKNVQAAAKAARGELETLIRNRVDAEVVSNIVPLKPAAKKPAAKKPVAKKPVAKKPAAKKPVAKKPAAKKPAAKKPAAKKPVAKKPVAKKPATKKPATKKPASKT